MTSTTSNLGMGGGAAPAGQEYNGQGVLVPKVATPPITPTPTPTTGQGTQTQPQSDPTKINAPSSAGTQPTATQQGIGNPTGGGNYGSTASNPYGWSTVNGQIVANKAPSDTPSPSANGGLSEDPAEYQKRVNDIGDRIYQLGMGTLPLSPAEQSQIDGLKQQWEQSIATQGLVNTNNAGTAQIRGYQTGAAEFDPTFQATTIGNIVTAGKTKITQMQTEESSAIATLTQALQSNDLKMAQSAYDSYVQIHADVAQSIKDTVANTQKAMQDNAIANVISSGTTDPAGILKALQASGNTTITADDITKAISNLSPDAKNIMQIMQTAAANGASPDVLKAIGASKTATAALLAAGNSLSLPDINSILKTAANNNAPASVLTAIKSAANLSDAISAAGKYANTLTGDMGQYYQYVQDAQAKGQVPSSYTDWENKNTYNKAYATASGSAAGKAKADAQSSGTAGLNSTGIGFWADAAASGVNTNSLLPSLGMGSAAVAVKQALLQKIADNAKNLGISGSTFAAALTDSRAKQSTYTKLQQQGSMLSANEQKATSDMALVKSLGAKMDANSWQLATPILNDWMRTGQVALTGNDAVNNFLGALTTTMTAYAKVVSGQTTGQGVTDSANRETANLIKNGLSTSAVNSYFDNVATPEMKNTVDSYNTSLQSLFGSIEEANQSAGATGGLGSTSQQLTQAENNAQDSVTAAAKSNPSLVPQITKMLDTNNPSTGLPYTYQEIGQIIGITQ